MTTKRLLALLIAVFMLVALFSACANTNNDSKTPSDSGSSANTPDDSGTEDKGNDDKDDGKTDDTPVEKEPLTLTYMGQESHNWTYTYEEAVAKGFETIKYYNDKMLEEHNLIVNLDVIDNEAYKTTLSGYLASNTLDDAFLCNNVNFMDTEVLVNSINQGRFANLNDIAEFSDGTFSGLIADGGKYQYLKAWNIAPDGGWYYIGCADGNGTSFNFDHDDVDYINNWPLHTWYNLNIRVDWLNKCGLSMPTTTEEFAEALVQFQAQDANGNGAADERAFLGIGMASEQVFGHTTAGWFGLPPRNFYMNNATGVVENPVDMGDQYLAFIDFTADLYAKGVAYINEGGAWAYGANVAGNYCAAQVMYPDNLITAQTGDPDTQYEPMPIIQAIEGVAPRMVGQSVTTANNGLAFRADVDMEAAAAYLDWLNGETFYMLLCYGIEGKSYDITDEGKVYQYKVPTDISKEDEESYGDMWHFAPWGMFPQIQAGFAWDPVQAEYTSVQDALDAGEPYTWKNLTIDQWKEQYKDYNWTDMSNLNRFFLYLNDFGADNIVFSMNVDFYTLSNDEETAVISQYESDLKTYLAEMTTSYITGTKSTDTYEADLQYAYDNLGMQEYIDVQQSRADRFLVAMGRDAILG